MNGEDREDMGMEQFQELGAALPGWDRNQTIREERRGHLGLECHS